MARQGREEKPQRSCLGCRGSHDRGRLIRFVLSPQGEVLPDLDARLPGRGAYTCISAACLETALRQRLFNRAFRREVVTLQPQAMTEMVARLMRERILGYLGLANRAGKIVSGSSMVCEALRARVKPGLVLVATDTSAAIAEKVVSLAALHGIDCQRALTKEEFGAILGKAPRSAVAIRQGGFIARLVTEIQRLRNFLGEV